MEQIHSLLKRQLRRHFGDQFNIPQEWQGFIDSVNDAYWESDSDRGMLEHSLELSSYELLQANSEMRAIFLAIPDLLFRLDAEGKILNYKAGATTDLFLHPKELLGKRIQDVPLKHVSDKFHEAIQQVQNSKTIINFEYSLSIQDQPLFFEARLVPLPEDQIVIIIRNITERKQAEEALHKREEAQRFFSERLTRVLKTINELSKIESYDEFCRRSVELALERLGFDRVGLCFLSEDRQTLFGVYGTDEEGHLRNEKHLKRPIKDTPTVELLLKGQESVLFFKEEVLYNDQIHQVGIGDHAVTRLWNGENIIGIYAVDNLIRQTAITDEDLKILDIYGTSMGHLFTLKRAEEDLFNSQQMLRMVLDTIPQRVFWKDRELFFVGCNKPLALDCGYSDPNELIGKTDYETASAKAAEFYRTDDRQVIETGQPKLNYEESQIKPDGSLGWLRTSKLPLRDKVGRVIGVLGTYEDITEQKRAMEALTLLSHTVKSIGESISITDLRNNILFVNEAFLKTYGYTEQEIIGKSISIVTYDPVINDQEVLRETIKGGWQGELMNRKKDGTVFSIFLSTSIVNDERGQPIGLVGVATDITKHKHAEEALQESNDKLRNIVENSTNLFYSRNTDQVFTYLSPQVKNILDCEPEEALVNFTNFMTINSINKLGCDLANKAVQTGARQETYELELMSRKGRRVWVEMQEAPVVKNGKTISIVGAATDITERRWAERALQVSEKKYRDIVTWAPIGIYQSTLAGKLLSCNSSIAELLGYDNVNELVGCNMGQAVYFDDKDRERFIAKDNTTEKKATFSHETRWKTKNGSIIWVLMTVHDVRDKSSEILYYEGFVFDITERKHAEESLRESEERYRLLVENSTDIVTEISGEDKYLYVSPNVKSILDFEPMDLVGTEVLSRVYGKDKAVIGEILSKLGGSATYRYRDRMGGWHWFESSGRVYYTSSGEQRMVMVSRDITQRRKAEQELELSRKQLQHFTEHLEHVLEEERKRISRELHDELGQLLTILKFDISWLRLEGIKSDSETIAKIDGMLESVNEALASVKRIAKEIRPPQLDALGLVGAIQWDIDQTEKKTGLKGIVSVEPADFEIKGQISTVLYRVFREALTNILRHAQAEQIFIRLSQRLDSVILTIRDDGRGITKKELKGTSSLGLVGIRERIRMVGGTLVIEGKTGSGTLLSIEVPLKKKNGESKS
jgi:PAS domain S-box-containing protein